MDSTISIPTAKALSSKLSQSAQLSNDNFRPLYILNSNHSKYKSIGDRFHQRHTHLLQVCGDMSTEELQKVPKRPKGANQEFANRFYLWCHVPKVGTTFLQYLNRRIKQKLEDEKTESNSENEKRIKYPPSSKSLLMVREPYSRLVSGYIGKIVTNQPWWKWYGRSIVKKFRQNATEMEQNCGNDVSFPEFIKYFISAQTNSWKRNSHFVPMHELCDPCKRKFDFVGHLETFGDDIKHLLDEAHTGQLNLSFSDEESTMKGKARNIISQKKKILLCESMCSVLDKIWWSFQARGLVSKDIPLPVREDECNIILGEDFANRSWAAHLRSVGMINKSKQKRQAMVDLFLQVPLADRLKVRDLLALDFQLFGYDPQPSDIFPELVPQS